MTREEAINYLERSMAIGEDDGSRHHNEVLEFTIKTLEQEPCEDCVSRKAVDHLCFEFLRANSDDNIAFYEHFRDLPSVTPIRKKARWIFTKTNFDRHGCTVECSFCYKKWKTYDEIRWEKENKYCPNCGAEMESEE